MPRRQHCGKYERTPEIIERQREQLQVYWADPEIRRKHGAFTRIRMARPGVSEIISTATKAALARRRETRVMLSGPTEPSFPRCVSSEDRSGGAP